MKGFALLCLVSVGLSAQSRPTQSGSASASGTCAVSHSGNSDTIIIKDCGIGAEQGKKIIALLKEVMTGQNLDEINAKLDELINVASKPAKIQNCTESNCVQGTNYGPLTYNQFGAPKLEMTDAQRNSITDAMKEFPGLNVSVGCENATEDAPAFAEKLYQALHNAGMKIEEPSCARMIGTYGPPHPGVTFSVSPDRQNEANVLEKAMVDAGVLPTPVPLEVVPFNGILSITVRPNR
ncbi:MAG: hypothetical protein WCE63_06100 [Acidobacteriaceae bacterium]